jgi:DNA-directed RNA polymerase specialized sigma24 family protein
LRELLVAIARNKLGGQIRRHRAQRRDARKGVTLDGIDATQAASDTDPCELLAGQEMLERVRARLDPEERRLSELRQQGHGWPEVAEIMGGTPDGRRMQLERALRRATQGLGLEGGGDA